MVRFGFVWMDAAFAVVVAIFIARAGYLIFRETVPILVDASALPADEVIRVVKAVDGVSDVRHIRTRGWEGNYFIDLTIVAPIEDSRRAHDVTELVEAALRNRYGEAVITVHVEPD